MIVLNDKKETLEKLWDNVEYVGTSADNPYALENRDRCFHLQRPEIRHPRPTLAPGETLALINPVKRHGTGGDNRPRARTLQLQ